MFREIIVNLSQGNQWVNIQQPCSESTIQAAENIVGHTFPKELKELLREMNGDKWCILSAEEIMENVERNREIYLPLFEMDLSREEYEEKIDRFVFFGTNGCGDYYCYRVRPDGTTDESAIYIWEHEELAEPCCWKVVASSMAEFLTRYYKDEI